jgi:hypothetical protein
MMRRLGILYEFIGDSEECENANKFAAGNLTVVIRPDSC